MGRFAVAIVALAIAAGVVWRIAGAASLHPNEGDPGPGGGSLPPEGWFLVGAAVLAFLLLVLGPLFRHRR